MQKNEEWRDVLGFEGRYMVSSTGRVKSMPRFAAGKNGSKRLIGGRILKPTKIQGYPCVNLSQGNGKSKTVRVHRLVAFAFLGPPPRRKLVGYMKQVIVAHNDGSRTNNCVENLRWASPTENAADRQIHGKASEGEKHPHAKLNNQAVREIRQRHEAGEHPESIAPDYNVSVGTTWAVVKRRAWKSVA